MPGTVDILKVGERAAPAKVAAYVETLRAAGCGRVLIVTDRFRVSLNFSAALRDKFKVSGEATPELGFSGDIVVGSTRWLMTHGAELATQRSLVDHLFVRAVALETDDWIGVRTAFPNTPITVIGLEDITRGVPEPPKKKRFTAGPTSLLRFLLSKETVTKLDQIAEKEEITRSELCRKALEAWFAGELKGIVAKPPPPSRSRLIDIQVAADMVPKIETSATAEVLTKSSFCRRAVEIYLVLLGS